jgi:pimeloyl-ACP methyl ester carboxylesterase
VGSGKPALLLHGWGANTAAMQPIAKCLAGLGREAVTLDFPGFGQSGAPPLAWGVPEYAACVREFMRALGIEGCDVVAHSFGGRVTLLLASAEPTLFGKLVLVDAAGLRPKRKPVYYFKVYGYKLGKLLGRVPLFDRLFRIGERQKSAGSVEYQQLSGVMRATFVKVVNLNLTGTLKRIPNETLLVWGSEDRETPLWMAKKMRREMPNAGLAILPGAGHFSYLDDYPRFCAMMKILFEV